ncbi:Inositol 2-dehydrogenase [Planctomycetes bacterium Pan216]|uniref:Inositol 2-dehydrogenase n=1 Tax=Kolteria novifilia TaxID=2527975 RepID=A0A518BCW0_9BACT|nr:Inositol 2-dehydrogenase [Planctomycetes bacterium Pan216]
MRLTRRNFLASAASAAVLAPTARVLGANDDIRVGVVGLRGRGAAHVRAFGKMDGVRVAALCEVDEAILDQRAKEFEEPFGKMTKYQDIRKLLEDPSIDALCIATPNHWHALATIWGCQAGKDVYVEKPVAFDLWEGRQMINAARKHDRIVQVGTQRRSDEQLREWLPRLRDGELGKVKRVRVIHFSNRKSIGPPVASGKPPASVNHDLWSGPAPLGPITRQNYHYDWHWFWDTGNGELGNNGPHSLDLARWVIGADAFPKGVVSIGGRYGWNDSGETPNTHVVYYDYEPAPILIEVRNLPTPKEQLPSGVKVGMVVECEHGSYAGMHKGTIFDEKGKVVQKINGDGGRGHQANFINAMRSRKSGDLNCDIEQGHLSTGLCHLGNISHRVGAAASPEQIKEHVQGGSFTAEAYERMLGHLQENKALPQGTTITQGLQLSFDPATERFVGSDAETANRLLRREYRKPYVVPEQV